VDIDQEKERQITLIVPTVHHRSRLFARVLRYFTERGFRSPIIVTDHSPPENDRVISDIAARHGDLDLRVLRHSPDIHFLERLISCAKEAHTPYVHLHADDDFVLRPMLARLAQELHEKPGCAAAMGINVHAEFASRDLTVASKGNIGGRTPFDRLLAQLESYSSVRSEEHTSELQSRSDLVCRLFFNDTATSEIYTLSLHDALPISP